MESKVLNTKYLKIVIVIYSLLSIFFVFYTQLAHLNSFASSWDQVDFALALERYDLMAMQPHFPGYPYFILGGYFIHLFIENKIASLTLFNILFYFSSILPMYKLAKEVCSKESSLFISAILYSSTYTLIIVNQPMSEGAAIAALWWYFWSVIKATKDNKPWLNIMPLILFSVLLGIRLSYLPFAVGILFLFYKKWRNKQFRFKHVVNYSMIAVMLQLIWVVALIISEGSVKGFLKLSTAFTNGHFNSWGNTAVSSAVPFPIRLKTIILDNVLWTGIAAQSIAIALLFGILLCLFIYKWKRVSTGAILQLALLMSVSYFFWALLAQNIDKPRHILPLIGLILFVLLINLVNKPEVSLTLFLSCTLLALQLSQSYKYIKVQSNEIPASYQLANFLKEYNQDSIVYTWEETRVLEYNEVPQSHKKVQTFEFFLLDQSYYKDKTILLTDKAVDGFKAQGIDISKKIEKVNTFKSSPIFDPVYNEIILYKWR
ncbi:glycosyltransferase family 39 protein [Peribacillus alkalitolerans]|uniref:glycosyltransferase family 39 protein n=1 Tax=Peribacillus alkalitolerans TaxID=1550385 RepID=UPI0013D83A30|nr:glycosyltransferase family 39 protein [Peribacillus alkalitolerans]